VGAAPGFEVVAGGAPTADEVAAIAAALEVVLGRRADEAPPVSPWRWSGRPWLELGARDWRRSRFAAHPSRL